MTKEEIAKLEPTANRVVIQETREVKIGSIILAESSQTKNAFAKVIAVGPNTDPSIEVGAKVLIEKYVGTELLDEGSEVYSVVTDDDILGIVNE